MALLRRRKRKGVSAVNVETKQDLTFVEFYIKLFGKIKIAHGNLWVLVSGNLVDWMNRS